MIRLRHFLIKLLAGDMFVMLNAAVCKPVDYKGSILYLPARWGDSLVEISYVCGKSDYIIGHKDAIKKVEKA
jgi:hypothetical protein